MKKLLAFTLVAVMVLSLAACGSSTTPTATPGSDSKTVEIALVTDVGNIDDKSFNEGSWNGVKEYGTANNVTYDYYRPFENTNAARIDSMETAIENGAKVIVCPGYLFEESVLEMQDKYPEVMFLVLDLSLGDNTKANTNCVLYQEEQAGFFAGYAAVMDGYRNLGFLGGMNVPAVIRYGFGFVQGADAASVELGLAKDDVSIKYWYGGTFGPDDDVKTKMDGWYADGTEVVFACGGGIYLSALAAAESVDGKLIGVDVDQAYVSPLFITSAMKELTGSVVQALTSLYANDGKWDDAHAGKTTLLGAGSDGVGLPTAADSWRLETYTVADYEALFADVVSGTVAISDAIDANPSVVNISVDYQ